MENAQDKKTRRLPLSTRAIALLLAVMLALTSSLTSLALASRITIRPGERTEDAGRNYLVNHTEYVQENPMQRMASYIGSRGARQTLQDYYDLAGTQIARESYAEALISIERCIELFHDESDALLIDLWLKKGCLLVLLDKLEEAVIALTKVTELDPANPDAYLVKAQAYAGLALYQELQECLEAYLVLVPDDQEIALLLAQLSGEGEGGAYAQEKQAQDTVQSAEAGVPGGDPGDAAPADPASSAFLEGLYAMQDGDFAAAEEAISRAIAMDAGLEGAHYYRGVCRLSLEDYAGAAEDFAVSISQGHMVHSSYYNRGISLIMIDDYDPGLADIHVAAALTEDSGIQARAEQFLEQVREAEAEAQLTQHLIMAQLSADLEDLAGVCEHLEAYLDEAPDDLSIRHTLAQARFAAGEYELALVQYEIILQAEQTEEAEYLYGLTALQMADFALAEQALSRSIALAGNSLGVYYYRGVCRLSLEDYRGAADDFSLSIRNGDMVHSSLFNRGISRLMMDEEKAGMEDIETAAGMEEDEDIKEQAKRLLTDIEKERASQTRPGEVDW